MAAVCLLICITLRFTYEGLQFDTTSWPLVDDLRVILLKLLMMLFTPAKLLAQFIASTHLPFYKFRFILECVFTAAGLFVAWRLLTLPRKQTLTEPNEVAGQTVETTIPEAKIPNANAPGPMQQANHARFISSRRQFLKIGAAVTTITPATALGYGTFWEPFQLAVREYSLPLKNLHPSFAGLRIAQITDTHYGPFISLNQIRDAVERANALKPDLVFLTGDYVLDSPNFIEDGLRPFKALTPRLATLAVLGNHDHWEGADLIRNQLRQQGARMMDNERLFLTQSGELVDTEPEEECLALCGLGDFWTDKMKFDDVLTGLRPTTPRLVLAHNPDSADVLPRSLRCDALFCGHTHGGQVNLPGVPNMAPVQNKAYTGGLCQGPTSLVFVSRGVGMSVLPYRLNVPPEISLITLAVG